MSRAFRLGVFIFGTLTILAAGIFLIGNKRYLFASTYRLKAGFKNVAGLNNGAEVRVFKFSRKNDAVSVPRILSSGCLPATSNTDVTPDVTPTVSTLR